MKNDCRKNEFPPVPASTHYRTDIEPNEIRLTGAIRRRDIMFFAGLIVALIVIATNDLEKNPQLVVLCFFAFLLFFTHILLPLLYREEIRLDADGFRFRSTHSFGLFYRERKIPIREIKQFKIYTCTFQRKGGREETLYGIAAETFGFPFLFSQGGRSEEVLFQIFHLNELLGRLKSDVSPEEISFDFSEPPEDCRFETETGFDSTVFMFQERFHTSHFLAFLFFAACFFGLAVLFLAVSVGYLDENIAVFSIPWFVTTTSGIVFLFTGLYFLQENFAFCLGKTFRTKWIVSRNEIIRTRPLLFFERNTKRSLADFAKLIVISHPLLLPDRHEAWTRRATSADISYELVFQDRSEKKIASIESLTEGEAHWLAQNLLSSHLESV